MLRRLTEGLARRTTRRGLLSRGADVAFGALAGVAAGSATRAGRLIAGGNTVCIFPGRPCPCNGCLSNGTCAKPCLINTTFYPSGCWVTGSVTCCDCDCDTIDGNGWCGCGSDFHNNPDICPFGNASDG